MSKQVSPVLGLRRGSRWACPRAVVPQGGIGVFAAAGIPRPDLSILSDEFLAEVRGMEQRNLAVELSQKILRV